MSFLYYLPGLQAKPTAQQIEAAGLLYALGDGGKASARGVRGGPDGGNGQLVAVGAELIGYHPERQTWRQIPGSECWIGWETLPTPEQLLRPDALAGHPVTLGDGRQWQIPVARGWSRDGDDVHWYVALPQTTELDDEGNWKMGAVVPRYRTLWDAATAFHDLLIGLAREAVADTDAETVRDEVPEADMRDVALLALSTNYRIGRIEAVLLGLLDTDRIRPILDALVDQPTWLRFCEDMQKKTGPDPSAGSSSSVGVEDSTLDTDPASPT